ncbi:MAG: 3-hydroxyacyl-ACP dehydratase FabZ [Deltaproteobacteria bacterium]|nr:3-hydroxyacyl-ACP dehydratase FabZ [Deltaproteobacteria bacterium]
MNRDLTGEIVSTEILELLPHRYPFLLVDRILRYESLKYADAIKAVTINEPFFQGHFPNYPVMPGVLILEAMAQTGAILVAKSIPNLAATKLFLFTGIEKVRFRRSVFPGDVINLHVEHMKHKLNLWKIQAEAKVDGGLVAQGILTAAIVDRED